MRKAIGAVLAVVLAVPALVHAESASLSHALYHHMNHLAATPLQAAASKEAARLSLPRQTQVTPQRKNWAARHPVLLGTMVGAGTGLAFVAAEGCDSSDYSCGGLVAFFGGTGALLGAGAGGIASIFLR